MVSYLSHTKGGQEVEISEDGGSLYLRVTPTKPRRREYVAVPNGAKARLALRVWLFSFSYDPVERMMVPFVACGPKGGRKLLLSEILLGPDFLRQIGP